MSGIQRTFEHLQILRRKFESTLAESRSGRTSALPPGVVAATQLQHLRAFGSNPGNLRMLAHVPDRLPAHPPLVIALHGCGQSATEYELGTGWSDLADRLGFVVVYPEQQGANNPKTCFSWFQPGDFSRDAGEALSIRQMVDHAAAIFNVDDRQVFVTGLSAGGAMASVMLATYPETFAAGAIIAGLPYGCARSAHEALDLMFSDRVFPPRALGDHVRSASAHQGPWPRVSVWHGAADTIVRPANADSIVRQWCDVHGLDAGPGTVETINGHERRQWTGADGRPRIEAYAIAGMPHGVPIAPASGGIGSGSVGPFFHDVGLASTQCIAGFWGLGEPVAQSVLEPSLAARRPVEIGTASGPAPSAEAAFEARNSPMDSALQDSCRTIEAALKAAGLPVSGQPKGGRRRTIDPSAIIAAALKAAGLKR